MLKRMLAAALIAGAVTAAAPANAGDANDRYRRVAGDGPARVVFRGDCLNAEDSAAHVRLIAYDGDRVVFGCADAGY